MANLNLLPEGYLRQRLQYRVDMLCVLLFGIVMVSIMTAEAISSRQVQETRIAFENVTEREAAAADQVRAFFAQRNEKRRLLEKSQVLAGIAPAVPRSLLLALVTDMSPQDMTIVSMEIKDTVIVPQVPEEEQQGRRRVAGNKKAEEAKKEFQPPPATQLKMTLSGLSEAYEDITRFLNQLKQSPMIADVDVEYTRERKMGDRMLLDFRMHVLLRPTPDLLGLIDSEVVQPLLSAQESGTIPADQSPAQAPALPGEEGGS